MRACMRTSAWDGSVLCRSSACIRGLAAPLPELHADAPSAHCACVCIMPAASCVLHSWFNGLFIASALVTAILYYAHYKATAGEAHESLLPTTHKTAASKA